MSVKENKIEGDAIISGDVTTGGGVTANGSSVFKKNLKVEGWLEASNIQTPYKGLFQTDLMLKSKYPNPQVGWWAMVGEGLPAKVYIVDVDQWIDSGKTTTGLSHEDLIPNIDSLRESIEAVEASIQTEKEERIESDTELLTHIETEITDRQRAIASEKTERQRAIASEKEERQTQDNFLRTDLNLLDRRVISLDKFVVVEVPDLTKEDWGLVEQSDEANSIVETLLGARISGKTILLKDTYYTVPTSSFSDEDVSVTLTYTIGGYEGPIEYRKFIERGGYIGNDDKFNLSIGFLNFYSLVDVSPNAINASYTGNDDLIVFNNTTKTFISLVRISGVLQPQYFGNSPKLIALAEKGIIGKSTIRGYAPASNILYTTSSTLYLWDRTNLNPILKSTSEPISE